MRVVARVAGILFFVHMFQMLIEAAVILGIGVATLVLTVGIVIMAIETEFGRGHRALGTARRIVLLQDVTVLRTVGA